MTLTLLRALVVGDLEVFVEIDQVSERLQVNVHSAYEHVSGGVLPEWTLLL